MFFDPLRTTSEIVVVIFVNQMFDLCCLILFFAEYKVFRGQVLDDKDVSELYDGLKLNNITNFSHVLTGRLNFCLTQAGSS